LSAWAPQAVSSNAVPSTLSVAETEDACKYAQVAKVAYESSKDLVSIVDQ
jgi:hypothetical protein